MFQQIAVPGSSSAMKVSQYLKMSVSIYQSPQHSMPEDLTLISKCFLLMIAQCISYSYQYNCCCSQLHSLWYGSCRKAEGVFIPAAAWPAIPLCEQFTDLNRSSYSCSKLLLTLHRGVLQQTCVSMTSPRSIFQHCRGSVTWNTTNFCTGNIHQYSFSGGTWWCNWLMHCVTSQVTHSILNYVTGILHWHNPTGRIMALGSTQSLTQMSTRDISWVGGFRVAMYRADNLTTFVCRLSRKQWASTSWNPSGPIIGLYRDSWFIY